MIIDFNVISAWTGIFSLIVTIVFFWFGHWSRKQDRAIKDVQDKIRGLRSQTTELRRYIRQLLHIMKNHAIDYPTPPDSFYDTDPHFDYQRVKDDNS